jgi:serine/threonine protein kinase
MFEELLTEKEVWIISSNSPFIIQLYCTFQCSKSLCFLIEYACDGDLMDQLNKNGGRFAELLTRFYACEIICAIDYLHRNSIVYRDLKLENVLLTRDGHVKLTDFGMSKIIDTKGTTTFCGTAECMAPEVAKIYFAKTPQDLAAYNFMVDYFSLGVMIFHMITGFSPFNRDDNEREKVLKSIIDYSPEFPKSTSTDVQKCVYGLLEKDYKKRLGSKDSPYGQLKEQSFFANVEWDKIELGAIEPPLKPHYITLSQNSEEIKFEDEEGDKFDFLNDIFNDFDFISEYFR